MEIVVIVMCSFGACHLHNDNGIRKNNKKNTEYFDTKTHNADAVRILRIDVSLN